jgi:hypothetical protein
LDAEGRNGTGGMARSTSDAQERALDRWERDLELLMEVEEAAPVAAGDEQEVIHGSE